MIKKLIGNDIRQNRLFSAATVFFMTFSAMLTALTLLLLSGLMGAIDDLMDQARVPDYMQMHTKDKTAMETGEDIWESEKAQIVRFAESCESVSKWQICPFLNLDNSRITLGGHNLADSTQDNGLTVQGKKFDYLLDTDNKIPEVLPGEVYVPVCYRSRYGLSVGDTMVLEDQTAFGEGETGKRKLIIAGFLRDAQMNSMMASSKRFLVNEADYESIKKIPKPESTVENDIESASEKNTPITSGNASENTSGLYTEEYLIEFQLRDTADLNDFETAYTDAGLPANGPAITRPLVRTMNALSDGTMIFVIFLVSIAALLISMLCIRFILSLQMERDRKEVGMLKALGIGKREIRRIYLAKYLFFSVCAAVMGTLAAFMLKPPLEKQIRELYGAPAGGFVVGAIALSAVFFTEGILLFSVNRTLKKTDQISALEAVYPAKDKGKNVQGRQYFLIGAVAAACTFLALVPQNLYSTISAPGFVTYMGIGEGEVRMDVRQTGDIDGVTEQIALCLEQDTRVEKYAVLRTSSYMAVMDNGKKINLSVETGDHEIFPVSYSEGEAPKREKEIALSSLNAKELGLSVGDGLRLLTDKDGTDYTVCGIYSDITNGGKTAKAYSIDGAGTAVWSVIYVSLKESYTGEPTVKEQTADRSGVKEPSAGEQTKDRSGAKESSVGEQTTDRSGAKEPAAGEQTAGRSTEMRSGTEELTGKERWMEEYRKRGADVIEIRDYVRDTYSQTLKQLRLASVSALGAAFSIIAVVILLFMRLIIEKNRYTISLYKALGVSGKMMTQIYFVKGILPAAIGIWSGLLIGNPGGEGICGSIFKSFGVDGFRFTIAPVETVLTLFFLLITAAAAVRGGIAQIKRIAAYECCRGHE